MRVTAATIDKSVNQLVEFWVSVLNVKMFYVQDLNERMNRTRTVKH